MKKIFTLSLMAFFALVINAQSTHTIDFETTGVGADWNWIVAENGDNPDLEFVANPVSGGINTSATVGMFTAQSSGAAWALFHTGDDGEFTFDATNSTIKIMVFKTRVSDVGFKVEGLGPNTEIKVANTKINEWEELTFDFSAIEGESYNRLVIIPDFDARDQDNIIYFDNIQVPDGVVTGPLPEPTTGAPVPAHDAANVLSIYSDTYTSVAGTNFNPGWGQSTQVTIDYDVDGNNTLKYDGLNYQGTEFSAAQNTSGYDYLHVDFWTPNSTRLDFFLISTGVETSYSLPISSEQWVSVEIPLSSYSSVVDLADVIQFKVDGNGTIYFDNLYFYTGTPTAIDNLKTSSVRVFPNPTTDILNIDGVEAGEVVEIYSTTGSLVRKQTVNKGTVSLAELKRGVYFIKVNEQTIKVIKK